MKQDLNEAMHWYGKASQGTGKDVDRAKQKLVSLKADIENKAVTARQAEQIQRDRAHQIAESMKQEKQVYRSGYTEKDAPMVLVPAGDFLFGEHNQRIPLPDFYIDMYEVTTQLYAAFMEAAGHGKPEHWDDVRLDSDGQLPVIGVEWSDADAYCRYYGKRLPREKEWEKAARGVDGRSYPWGNTKPTKNLANIGPHICGLFCNVYEEQLRPVRSYEGGRSPSGIYNMVGNVREWVEEKGVRGGSWINPEPEIKNAITHTVAISWTWGRRYTNGFRCAQDPQ